jgi:hypothetical protein
MTMTEAAPTSSARSASDLSIAPRATSPREGKSVLARRRCPYCLSRVVVDAKKCRHCGEWLVPTSSGAASALLRAVGWLWFLASGAGAFGLWHLVTMWRSRVILEPPDPGMPSPETIAALLYGAVGLVAIQGVVLGLGMTVLGRLVPRRPR